MVRNPVTPAGYEALVRDLKHLKEVSRPAVVRDIEEARAHGDISENSEYEDAKERQSHIEGRIAELENMVARADVIDVTRLPRDNRVVFGTTVVLTNTHTDDTRAWRIVGENETNVSKGQISYKSPLARAVIGRSVEDIVDVPTPGGAQQWIISEVRYE